VGFVIFLIVTIGRLYMFVLLARVLISFVQIDPYHPAVQFLYQITEPVLQPLRQILPPAGGLDFSPFVAMLLVQLLTSVIASTFGA
jgi:YggT family protein